jgi:hypothetical protein
MKFTLLCQHKISALYDEGNKLAEIAAGVFTTTDDKLAKFLKGYPGVSLLSEQAEKPAPANAGQADQCPEPVVVIHGGFSGGGAAAARIKRQ